MQGAREMLVVNEEDRSVLINKGRAAQVRDSPAAVELSGAGPERCSVCHGRPLLFFMQVGPVPYWRCGHCGATLMDPGHWLSREQERALYALHDNNPLDPGYRRFLSKLTGPLLARLTPGSRGLDFGCGPGPALAAMLREQGMEVSCYDPLFYPDQALLGRQWDFITCTEVLEHLHDPHRVFASLARMLKPGGWLALMTCFQTDDRCFARWHYRRDPSHVVFYRQSTLALIAARFGWRLEVPVKDVALFQDRKGDC